MILKPINPCSTCVLCQDGNGFVPPSGTGDNGVLIVGEAAGENESTDGVGFVGKAGQYLFSQLKRVGIDREGFRIANVLSCRPPDNQLAKAPYESEAIATCSPLLDATIAAHVTHCKTLGKTPTILTLGKIAFKRIMHLPERHPVMTVRGGYLCYVHWSERYGCWVIAADHPSYIMRGNHHLAPVLQFAAQRALEVASDGFTFEEPVYQLDPAPAVFAMWVRDYKAALASDPDNTLLSYDIETPYKKGKSEDQLNSLEDESFVILRCGFAYRENFAISVPWTTAYMPFIYELFATSGVIFGWNNCPTPDQRVLTADLRWVTAGSLKVGDVLVGMDEHVQPNRKLRRYKKSVVTRAQRGMASVMTVSFSDGTTVKVTENHPWLIAQRNRTFGLNGTSRVGGSQWVETKNLKVGQRIQRLLDTWIEDSSKDAGYLAGFFDGEGHLSFNQRGSMRLGAAQAIGSTLDYVLALLTSKGFQNTPKRHKRAKDSHICNFVVHNGTNGSARFLGSVRPQRLLAKFDPDGMGAVWHGNTDELTITAIESLGMQEIVELTTSASTYMLEGFAAHNSGYDDERVMAQMPIHGTLIDAMVAWHVLNSALPKGLGFVTPFYAKRFRLWKHESHASPALYNAIDALAALRCWLGIREGLKQTGLWPVFDRHVLQLNKALSYMSQIGLLRDEQFRDECEAKLTVMLAEVEGQIQGVIPDGARRHKVYKNTPKSVEGLVQVSERGLVKRCMACSLVFPTKPHFKRTKKTINPCADAGVSVVEEDISRWARPLVWKISVKGLLAYQSVKGHAAIRDKKSKKITFDKNAMKRLMKAHPADPLYPLIGRHHYLTKLLSSYVGRKQEDGRIIGGMPMGPDGAGHPSFTHNPSTLRLSCPFFHTLPRPDPKNPDAPHNWIRNTVIARPGHVLHARDFSGIEAVLVGYEAKDPGYIRLALRDVHTFYTVYALHQLDGRVLANDLPLLSWSDDKLFKRLEEFKQEFKADRNSLYKHLTHAINFGQGPEGAIEKIYKETNVIYPVPLVRKVMDIYKELFPSIPRWHKAVRREAHDHGYLTNAFGYVHRFSHVFRYVMENGQWVEKLGDDSEAALAFRPQSNAAGIIKESILRMYFDRFEEAGQHLRLQVHDENLGEPTIAELDTFDRVLVEEMERPIPQLPMPPEWNLGPFLRINTEPKTGERWGEMK